MIQAKFSLKDEHIQFLAQHKAYGFKDKSDVVRTALKRLAEEIGQKRLQASADLYTEVYEEDMETQELTDSTLAEWPE